MINVSILLPALNEQKNLEKLIPSIINKLKKNKNLGFFEIIVINDSSTDNTENLINNLNKKNKLIKGINLKKNIGKAYAIDFGIKLSNKKSKWICIIDSDNQYKPIYINKIITLIKKNTSFINTNRNKRKSNNIENLGSKFLNKLIFKFLIKKKYDYFSGLKVFKKSLYNKLGYRGLVRFLIFYCIEKNIKVNEINLIHASRFHGNSKYTFLKKLYLLVTDLLTILVFIKFSPKNLIKFQKKIISKIFVFLLIVCLISFFKFKFLFYTSTILIIFYALLSKLIIKFIEKKNLKGVNKSKIKSLVGFG